MTIFALFLSMYPTSEVFAQCNAPETLNLASLNNSADPVNDLNAAELTLGGGRVLISRYFAGNAIEDEYFIHDVQLAGYIGTHVGISNSTNVFDHVNLNYTFVNTLQGLSFRFIDLDRHDEVIINAKLDGNTIPITSANFSFPGANPCPLFLGNNIFKSGCFGNNLNNSLDGVIDFNFPGAVDEIEFIFYHDSAAAGNTAGGSFTIANVQGCAFDPGTPLGDNDGDGLENGKDEDDDNDGIPDYIEKDCDNNTVTFDFFQDNFSSNPSLAINDGIGVSGIPYKVGNAILTLDAPIYKGGSTQDEYQINNTHLNSTYAVRTGIDQTAPGPGQHVNTIYRLSEPVEDLCFFFNDLDRNDEVIINGKFNGITVDLSTSNFTLANTTPDPACPVWQGGNTWRSQCNPPIVNLNNSDRGGIQICFPSPINEIEIIFYDYTAGIEPDGTEGGSFSVSDFEVCVPVDTDGDGIPDYLDPDSDNDGCLDALEACHNQPIDLITGTISGPYGDNGLADAVETSPESGILNCTLTDFDNDGVPDYIDADQANCSDKDEDGIPDSIDLDDDGDGITDVLEGACISTPDELVDFESLAGQFGDLSQILNNASLGLEGCTMNFSRSFGGNAVPDEYTIDDEHLSGTFGPHIGVANSLGSNDFVRLSTSFECEVEGFCFLFNDLDREDEVVINGYLDNTMIMLSADDYTTGICVQPLGNNTFESACIASNLSNSTDGGINICFPSAIDRLDITFYHDGTASAGGSFTLADFKSINTCTPRDKDRDGVPDACDLDSDNDGVPDVVDAGGIDNDLNGDGQYDDPNGLGDANGDGLLDAVEVGFGTQDTDRDGFPDACDLDSDNDGIPDIIEAGGEDCNGDGYVDDFNPGTPTNFDLGGNGWSPIYDATDNGTPLPVSDYDEEGLADLDDIDSDNDGLPDLVETGGIDANGNGYVDDFDQENPETFDNEDRDGWSPIHDGDADNDGIIDNTDQLVICSLDDPANDPINPDDEGGLNHLDEDSDNDGCFDTVEGGGNDENNDGIIGDEADFVDSDNDGLSDIVDPDNGGTPLLFNDPFLDDYTNIDENTACGALPVELVLFEGTDHNCTVKLIWTTATETDFSHFEVEKSYDGISFIAMGTVLANGNAATGATYTFIDDDIKPVNYYRLKYVNTNATSEYSHILAIRSECYNNADVSVTDVYPNPATKSGLFIQMTVPFADGHVIAYITDALGRTVYEQTVSLDEGANLVKIQTQTLAPSTYYIKIQGTDWITSTQKFVIIE